MEKEDRELIKLLNDSKKGNKNSFEKFTRLVYQEVYNLVAFVYITKESREKLTKHVLVRMFKNALEFDNEELDIHLWIARFTTVEVYNVCKKQNGELFDTQISAEEYNYDSISEDSEFAKCAADYNQAFLDIDQLNEIMTDFEDFSKGQRLLYLMFAYESYTIDEIEDLLEIDSTFIGTQIMQIRGMLGLDMVSLDGGHKYMWQMRIHQRMRQMMKIVPMTVYLKLILMIMTIILTDMMLRVQIMELRQMHV